MKVNKLKKTCFLFLGISFSFMHAQEAAVAAGGDAIGSGGLASYSIGQVVCASDAGTNGTVSQGVQQPYEIFILGINTSANIKLTAVTYPNPTNDYVTLKISDYDVMSLSYQVSDIKGKIIESKKILGNQTDINLSTLATATYFIKVIGTNQKEIKTFKIIKN